MNRNGFTLVELLAVILILSTISVVAVLGISSSLERSNEDDLEKQIGLCKNSAKIYFSLLDKNSTVSCVNVTTLIEDDLLDDSKIDDSVKSGSVRRIKTGNEFQDEYQNSSC